MTRCSGKKAYVLDSIADAPDFDEEAFEKEYFPEGSFEEALERGLVEVSDGKGNWRKVEPTTRVTLTRSPAIRSRAETTAVP